MPAVAADFVITMAGSVLAPGWVAFDQGRIQEVARGPVPRELDLVGEASGRVLLPGFVSPHGHLALGALRGVGDDLPFLDWIHQAIMPGIMKLKETPGKLLEGARQSTGELLRGGVTLAGDCFFRREGVAALRKAGLPGLFFQEVFGSLDEDQEAYMARAGEELDRLPAELGSFPFGYSPHTPWSCPAKVLSWVLSRARKEGRRLSIHLDESWEEHALFAEERGPLFESLRARGMLRHYKLGQTPTALLADLGALGPDLLAVHCVQVTGEDIDLLAKSGTHVVHCPTSNMKLAEGIAPILPMLEAGVALSLGTDSAASSDRLNLFQEMRACLLVQRGLYRRIGPLTAETVLRMATRGGAAALGMEEETGSLEKGKRADLLLLDMRGSSLGARSDPVATVVLEAGPENVEGVWAGGGLLHSPGSPGP